MVDPNPLYSILYLVVEQSPVLDESDLEGYLPYALIRSTQSAFTRRKTGMNWLNCASTEELAS